MENQVTKIAPLTSLRFFAASAVVLSHFLLSYVPGANSSAAWGPLVRIAALGSSGVSLFFILSGFVLAYVYIYAPAGHLPRTVNRRSFWIARVARVYPIYVVALA